MHLFACPRTLWRFLLWRLAKMATWHQWAYLIPLLCQETISAWQSVYFRSEWINNKNEANPFLLCTFTVAHYQHKNNVKWLISDEKKKSWNENKNKWRLHKCVRESQKKKWISNMALRRVVAMSSTVFENCMRWDSFISLVTQFY